MVSKSTHTYKTVDSLDIKLDIYTRHADVSSNKYTVNTPVVLFFHGGGIVSHDRRLLPPSVVQSALIRRWPLVSADYRLFPQVTGLEVLDDVKDAYAFVREKLPGILKAGASPMKNVIVSGASAGKPPLVLEYVATS
jgi:acetyl esterase/lipase